MYTDSFFLTTMTRCLHPRTEREHKKSYLSAREQIFIAKELRTSKDIPTTLTMSPFELLRRTIAGIRAIWKIVKPQRIAYRVTYSQLPRFDSEAVRRNRATQSKYCRQQCVKAWQFIFLTRPNSYSSVWAWIIWILNAVHCDLYECNYGMKMTSAYICGKVSS